MKIDCNPGFHEVFCKTTIIRQLRRLNESKIQNTKIIFFVFLIFDSFHLLNCLMIVVLKKTP